MWQRKAVMDALEYQLSDGSSATIGPPQLDNPVYTFRKNPAVHSFFFLFWIGKRENSCIYDERNIHGGEIYLLANLY